MPITDAALALLLAITNPVNVAVLLWCGRRWTAIADEFERGQP